MPTHSWIPIPEGCHFSLANIPFGIISTEFSARHRPAVAIGEYALDLDEFSKQGGFDRLDICKDHLLVFQEPTLNAFATLGRDFHRAVRTYLRNIFAEDTTYPECLKSNMTVREQCLLPLATIKNHLPMFIRDYTDFFAGIHHAFNVGTMFRGPANALQPNYKHLPVGYHGRASSVVVSGTKIRRPCSQILENPSAECKIPSFKACRRLDIELELGAFLCKSNDIGDPVRIGTAEDAIFGYVLLNDWSARDIQTWEYVPLGPFNAKNFGTTISPWVVLADALEPFRCTGISNDTGLLPYLQSPIKDAFFDMDLEVDLKTKSGDTTTISRTNARNLLWSFPQMLAHHSVGGCPMSVGDLLGSGTISGSEKGTHGSLLEACEGGKGEIKLNGGESRKFLEDGDEITIRGWCGRDKLGLVGFGECAGAIEPALENY